MGYPGYIGANLITSESMLTTTTSDATYPKAGLCDGSSAVPFRLTSHEGGIAVDFGSEKFVNAIAVIEHNINTGATITLKAGNTSACSIWTESLTYTETNLFKHFGDHVGQTQEIGPFRYWNFEISGGTGPDVYIGEIILGELVHFTMGYLYGWTDTMIYTNVKASTPKGHIKGYDLAKQAYFGYKFEHLSSAQILEVKAMVSMAKGTLNPFVWVPNTGLSTCYFGYLTKDPTYTNQAEESYQAEIGFVESAHIVALP